MEIFRASHHSPILSPTSHQLQSLTGEQIRVWGTTQIDIADAGPITVYVVDNMSNDLILGIDAINAGGGTIDIPRKIFKWFSRDWSIVCDSMCALSGFAATCPAVESPIIIIIIKTEEEHAIVLQEVFSRLRKYGLRLKASKCNFGRHQVKLLGFILSEKGQAADPEKTKAISSLPPPRTVKQVRSFLGMTGYYRHCIPNYAKIANPLVQLTKKNRRFSWTQIHQTAFQSLKELLTSNYVMSHPDPQLPYKLYTDASDTCVGAILVQTKADGVEHVIQYVSHQLTRCV